MTAKEYLSQIRTLEARIRSLDNEIEALRETVGNLRSPWPDGQPHGSGVTNPVEAEAVKLADKLQKLEVEQIKTRGRLWVRRTQIIEDIGRIPDETAVILLTAKYVNGDTFEQIAVDIGYSYRQVLRKHGEALERFRAVMGSKLK